MAIFRWNDTTDRRRGASSRGGLRGLGLWAGLLFFGCAPEGQAASISIAFKAEAGKPVEYEAVFVGIWPAGISPYFNPSYAVVQEVVEATEFERTFAGLELGAYNVLVATGADHNKIYDATRPGAFTTLPALEVRLAAAGDDQRLEVQYRYFDPASVQGKGRASGAITDYIGDPMPGVDVRVVTQVPQAGIWEIARPTIGADGRFLVENLSPTRQYSVLGQGQLLGNLALDSTKVFMLAAGVGNKAPAISFERLADGGQEGLADFVGKVVVLEFWASWCGPCRGPMSKLQKLQAQHSEWGERVEVIALSVDKSREAAVQTLNKYSWHETHNVWAGAGDAHAITLLAFGVEGIPQVCVVDQNGKIAALDHPVVLDVSAVVGGLLQN